MLPINFNHYLLVKPQLLFSHRTLMLLPTDWRSLRETAINWAVVLFGLVVAQGATALALIVVARKVLPVEYGQYLAIYGLTSFLVVLPNYGLDVWLLTRGHSTSSEVGRLWGSSIRLRVQLLLIWIAGMMVLAVVLPADTFPVKIMLPAVLGVGFDSLTLLSYAAFRSSNWHGRVTLFQSASSLALLGITTLLPLRSGSIFLFASGRAMLSAILLTSVIAIAGKEYLKERTALIQTRDILVSARPFMVAELASSIYEKADLTIVSLFIGSSGASVYGPAINLLQVSFLASRALFLFVVPALSKAYVESSRSFMRKAVMQLVAQGLVGAVLSTIVFLSASFIISLVFGPAYGASSEILCLLSPIPFLRSLNFALGAILASGNRQSQRTRVQLLCAAFNVLANLVVIVPFGIAGVAVVYVLSELILASGYSFVTYNWLGKELRRNAPT